MKISWGIKITILYAGFVVLISTMVVAANRQRVDLVSNSYYADEIVYQKVIDAGKNQSQLSQPITVHANEQVVIIDLPAELKGKVLSGKVSFYSPVDPAWDKDFAINVVDNGISMPRSDLRKTHYTVKIDMSAGGKKYYQETALDLSK